MKKIVILSILVCLIFFSGCIFNPEDMIKQNAQVKQFLKEYPNAEMLIIHLTEQQAQAILPEIQEVCGAQIIAKEYYKATINDPDSGLNLIAYLDPNNKIVECVHKSGEVTAEKEEIEEKKEQEIVPVGEKCVIQSGSGLYCRDFTISADNDVITLKIMNIMTDSVQINYIALDEPNCILSIPKEIPADETNDFLLSCPRDIVSDEVIRTTITVKYSVGKGSLMKSTTGTLTGIVS